jgi:hypothetical protein
MEKRTIIWKNAENSFNDFPLLDENELRNITCGIYQLNLASSYMQEHLEGYCDILKILPFLPPKATKEKKINISFLNTIVNFVLNKSS